MIVYFDTSALIPLLIGGSGSVRAGRIWDAAEHVTSVRPIYPEARAALAQAGSLGRMTSEDRAMALDALGGSASSLVWSGSTPPSCPCGRPCAAPRDAGHAAIHLAAAARLHVDTGTLVAGDGDLCAAAGQLGITVASTASDDG